MDLNGIQKTISALGLEPVSKLTLLDGADLSAGHVPPFAPDAPALVLGLDGLQLSDFRRALSAVYPRDFMLKLLGKDGHVEEFPLSGLDGRSGVALLIPALSKGASFESFQEIIAHLRAPEDGCPWDKEQTHLSLRKHLLEESYETLSAMDDEDADKMREEFGDLLLQVVLNAQIAAESAEFNMAEVLQGINAKLIRRHPHVFGEVQVGGVGDVLSNWEKIKAGERKQQWNVEKGVLDGLPAALPALSQAQEFQDRAARVGFDWPEIEGVLEKIKEEIDEVRAAANPDELTDELGDLFFAIVNLARWKKIDAEAALRGASLKFKKRFKYVEKRAHALDRPMQEMSMQELDDLWNEAKQQARL
ncbi:MAG TPA: nucleoside triphosphate pyrophosphohydrolase [Anaerolineales bacterium]|jgi:tetrapyrrole methylase family protein/MazG family protein